MSIGNATILFEQIDCGLPCTEMKLGIAVGGLVGVRRSWAHYIYLYYIYTI